MLNAIIISARSYELPGFNAFSLASKLLKNTIQASHTFENRYIIRYNLRIFTKIISAYRQKFKNIQPRKEEQYSHRHVCTLTERNQTVFVT